MLCTNCTQIQAALLRRTGRPLLRGSWEWKGLEPLICAHCGAVLPERNNTEPLLEKLGQLSKFGLIEGGEPLLGVQPKTKEKGNDQCAE
jgi:MoaA/NifB/PqqE/SkfB family radical SAM enzyme